RARTIALRFGVDTTSWRSRASSDFNPEISHWLQRHARNEQDSLKSAFYVTVVLSAPGAGRSLTLTLGSDGRLQSYTEEGGAGSRTSSREPATVAAQALSELTGEGASSFRATTTASPARDGLDFVWEAPSSRPELNTWTARASVGPEGLRSCKLDANLAPRIREERSAARGPTLGLDAVNVAVFVVAYFSAFLMTVLAWIRRRLFRPLLFAGALIGAAAMAFDMFFGSAGQSQALRNSGSQLGVNIFFAILFGTIGWACPAAAGESWSRTVLSAQWRSLLLAVSGSLRTRAAGAAIFAGCLFGPLAASIPFACSALFPAARWNSFGESLLASPSPSFDWLTPPLSISALTAIAFLIPLAARVRWRLPSLALQFALAALAELNSPWLEQHFAAALLSALLGAALTLTVLHRFGILAALTALSVSHGLMDAAWLSSTASLPLQGSAGTIHFSLFALAAGSAWVAWRGREAPAEIATGSQADEPVSQRERLKSEFSLARQAQQRMLPDTAPQLPGLQVAAVCQPAKEVGGDLYDYPRLADGRQAFIVADVSGKGMPAALYMTLTKGLLTAASEECDDLAEVACRLNRHLREAGRRRVFVTAALAAVDERSGSLEYVRAGHNPIVWHSPTRGFTRLVKPSGMGLGVGPPALFGRTLEMERLDLADGDTVVLYSDGVTEAMNAELEQYGEERLESVVTANGHLGAGEMRQAVLDDLASQLAKPDLTEMERVTLSGAKGAIES
ncbi:MAG TPA: hypothetical protein DEH78_04405, partial [Solibacterales bacterium]|nr:hypothetical protein [Bryobacterales bacterium]